MRILITGSTGFIGSELVRFLREDGHEVYGLVRDPLKANESNLYCNFKDLPTKPILVENFDACIHLAGENIGGIWTKAKKERLVQSRLSSTEYLYKLFAGLKNPPKVFICASAFGYYGDKGEEIITEKSSKGKGFLADLCEQWENSANAFKTLGIKVINTRFGLVLGRKGALPKMAFPFRFFLGGKIGNGEQYISWIHIEDLVRAIHFLLLNPTIEGPINVCSPHPVPQKQFASSLAKTLHRPCFFRVPPFFLTLIFKEMGRELFLYSTRLYPEVLSLNGFKFVFPKIDKALQNLFYQG